jgi:hypothetical protein
MQLRLAVCVDYAVGGKSAIEFDRRLSQGNYGNLTAVL